MKVFTPKLSLLCAVACFGLPLVMQADPIMGTMQVAGVVDVGASFIDFLPVGGPTGNLGILGGGNSGTFAVYNLSDPAQTTTVTVKDLTGGPATGPVSIMDFITFGTTALSGDAINITSISPGSATVAGCFLTPAAVGDSCTPPNSPFTLTDVADSSNGAVAAGTPCAEGTTVTAGTVACGTSITFLFQGNATTPGGMVSSVSGTLSTQTVAAPSSVMDPHTYQDILAAIQANPNAFVQESFSGVITATALPTGVPEPNGSALMLGGLVLMGLGTVRRRRRAV